MGFLDQVKEVAQGVAKSTGDQIEIAKMNSEIKAIENKQKDLMAEVGQIMYRNYCEGNNVPEAIVEICQQIEETNKNINDLSVKVLAFKELKKCTVCGNIISINDVFCKKCGGRQENDNVVKDEDVAE